MTKSVRSDYGMNQFIRTGLASVLLVMFFTVVAVPQAAAVAISSCGDCHGYPPVDTISRGTPTGAVVGNHAKHATSYSYPCALCHPSAGYTYSHQTGTINMNSSFTSTAVSGSYSRGTGILQTNDLTGANLGLCAGTYCHSNGTGNTLNPGDPRSIISKNSPSWGTTTDCGSCHGSDSTGRPTGSDKANSHQNVTKHQSLTCEKCHYPTTTTGNTITDTAKHVNRFYDVVGTSGTYSFNYTYAPDGGTCSTSYCHGTGPVKWSNTTGTLNCSSCHTSMGAGGTAAYTGKHQKHVNTAGYDFSCEMCHSIQNNTVHVNGEVVPDTQSAELKFRNDSTTTWQTGQTYNSSPSTYKYRTLASNPYLSEAAVTPGYTSSGTVQTDGTLKWRDAGTCSTVWCHSNANPRTRTAGEAAGSLNAYRTVAFNDTNSCTICHLGPADVATMTGAADRLSTNHAEHLATDRYGLNTTNYTCNTCHKDTADNNNTLNTTTGYANHVNASKNVVFNTTFWGGGTWSAPNCSTNVYCHSTGDRLGGLGFTYRTLSWADSAITTCTPCHRGPESTVSAMKTGADRMSEAHAKHLATTDGHGANTNFTCNTCHKDAASDNTTISSYTVHVNKTKDVALNTWASGTWSSPNCSDTYCHSKGVTVSTGLTPTHSAVSWTGTITACNICHGTESGTNGAPAYANPRKSPTAATGTNWTFTSGSLSAAVGASDNNYVSYNNLSQDYIYITGFGFTTTDVPNGSTIRDITVIIEGNGTSGTAAERQLEVGLTKNGTAVTGTTITGANTQLYLTSDRELVLSGNDPLWGTTWTPAEIQAAGFGVAIRDFNTTANALNIDRVRVVVHTDAAPKKNSHSNHASSTCNACHSGTVSTGNSPITGFANHVDKTYDVAGANITSYTYNAAGGTCSNSCHGGLSGTAASGVPQWGVSELDCITCHVSAQDAGDGAPTRRAMTAEFNNTWSHKRTAGGVVTKYDCGVCHMEGDPATGSTTALHRNNLLEFRDPDTGFEIQGVTFSDATNSYTSTGAVVPNVDKATFARNTASNALEGLAQAVQINLCLKCHDAGGADAGIVVPGGTALRPFGTAPSHTPGNNVLDAKTHFATSNASYHPLMGKGNNPYVNSLTMEAPWNLAKTIAAFPARDTALGSGSWTTPTNIYTSNNAWATYNGTAQANLTARSFGFTATELPAGSNIWGIGVGIEGNGGSATAAQRQIRVALTKDGTTPATAWKTAIELRQTTDRIENIGGRGDMWGATWALTDISGNANFGVLISDNDTTAAALNIDYVRVVVYSDKSKGYLITCWDCHDSSAAGRTIGGANASVTAHGGALTLRRPYIYNAALGAATTQAADVGLCDLCHSTALYITGTNKLNSGFGGVDIGLKHTDASAAHDHRGNDWVCSTCHGSSWLDPAKPTRAEDVHGFDSFRAGNPDAFTTSWGVEPNSGYLKGARPYAFLRNNADKNSTANLARWDNWRPRYDGATTYALDSWGCSWNTVPSGGGTAPGAPCGRGDHAMTGPAAGTDDDYHTPYAPGGYY